MTMARMAGMVIAGGSLIFIFAAAPLSRIYGPQELEVRMAEIDANRSAYLLSQILFALGAVITALGFSLLSPTLRSSAGSALLPPLAAVLLLLGSAAWSLFVYRRALHPEAYFRDYASVPWYAWAYLVMTALALLLFGYLFLRAEYPGWIAYGTVLTMGALAAGAVFIPEWLPPQLTYLLTLLIGVVAILRP